MTLFCNKSLCKGEMSHTGKSIQEMGLDSLTDRFRNTLSCSSNIDNNKPDFKELDLGSPVSPLVTRTSGNAGAAGGPGGGGAAVSSSSSSSSSGSVSGKANAAQLGRRSDGKASSHSGELSGSSETSPTASESHRSTATKGNSKPGHRRLGSAGAPLIYSGGSFISASGSPSNAGAGSGGGGGGGNTATSSSSNSPNNLFPSGNICPSGKILKPAIVSKTASKTVVLGSGTGNYGHGSIVRGGGGGAKSGSPGDASVSGNISQSSGGEAMLVKRAMANSDPEEVKKAGNELYKKGHFVEALSLYERAISILPDNAAYRSNRAAVLTALGRLGEAVRECEEAVRLDPGYGRAHQRLASLYLR